MLGCREGSVFFTDIFFYYISIVQCLRKSNFDKKYFHKSSQVFVYSCLHCIWFICLFVCNKKGRAGFIPKGSKVAVDHASSPLFSYVNENKLKSIATYSSTCIFFFFLLSFKHNNFVSSQNSLAETCNSALTCSTSQNRRHKNLFVWHKSLHFPRSSSGHAFLTGVPGFFIQLRGFHFARSVTSNH